MHPDLKRALSAFAIAMVVVVALAHLLGGIALVRDNLGALVALVFLYVPASAAWRRHEDLRDYGFRARPLARGLAFGLGVPVVVFPLFALAFVGFYHFVCGSGAAGLARLAPPGACRGFRGGGPHAPPFGLGTVKLLFVQIVVVALPEELFFRGYLHELLERAFPPKRRVLGGGVGVALVLSSALFALAHLAVTPDPRRLAVFFPALLFGWMRSATGSILAGVSSHALSNVFIDLLQRMFL